jgi:hypothetical protein
MTAKDVSTKRASANFGVELFKSRHLMAHFPFAKSLSVEIETVLTVIIIVCRLAACLG